MTDYPNNIPAKLEIIKASEISAHLPVKRKPPGSLVMQETPGGTVLFCRLGIPFLAYSSRSLRFRTKAAAKAATGRAMTHTSTPVSPVAGVLAPGVTVLPPV